MKIYRYEADTVFQKHWMQLTSIVVCRLNSSLVQVMAWRRAGDKPLSEPMMTHASHILRSPHDDVIKWKHFPRNLTFVRGIHRSAVNSPHKGQWRGALMFSLICVWINGWVNNHRAGDLRRHRGHYDVIVMIKIFPVYLATHASHILHSPFISS